jgi:hypothetical protein
MDKAPGSINHHTKPNNDTYRRVAAGAAWPDGGGAGTTRVTHMVHTLFYLFLFFSPSTWYIASGALRQPRCKAGQKRRKQAARQLAVGKYHYSMTAVIRYLLHSPLPPCTVLGGRSVGGGADAVSVSDRSLGARLLFARGRTQRRREGDRSEALALA